MKEQDPFRDVFGLNYKGLNKEQALAQYESFAKNLDPMMANGLDIQTVTRNDGGHWYIWHPCIAMSFVLDASEVHRLYPSIKDDPIPASSLWSPFPE